jgi:hypothetical protein
LHPSQKIDHQIGCEQENHSFGLSFAAAALDFSSKNLREKG